MQEQTHVQPSLRISLFGAVQAWIEGKPLARLHSRKEAWLLALLALEGGKEVKRSTLALCLWPWPDSSESQSAYNLRKTLSNLKKALGTQAHRLEMPSARTLRLDLTGAEVDTLLLEAALRCKDKPSLEQAVALYQGPLVAECTEPWIIEPRERYAHTYGQALQELAALSFAEGDGEGAIRYARLAAAVNPLWEPAQRDLMRLLQSCGQHNAAVQVYQEFCRILRRDDVRAVPDPQTHSLYEQIRKQTCRHAAVAAKLPSSGAEDRPPSPRFLPQPLTPLVGRQSEVRDILARLTFSRLLTLTGTGGVGKTRLAIRAAEAAADGFEGGAWFVDLAALSEPDEVLPAVASALQVKEEGAKTLLDGIKADLHTHARLLVLDNCEHLHEPCARLAADLLSTCAGLKILATSRHSLGLSGEVLFRVPSLALPPEKALLKPENAEEYDAIRLFVERARQARADSTLTDRNTPPVAAICRRLDGIPLALELAAARVKLLSVEEIDARLESGFALLTGGDRTRPERYRTLHATLEWSCRLLSEPEQALLWKLSVFAGGWTLEASETICGDEDGSGIIEDLSGLAEKSLVVVETNTGKSRYRLLRTIRQYASERLTASGTEASVRSRHSDLFLRLSVEAAPYLEGPDQADWVERLAAEQDNLREALTWTLSLSGGAETGLRLASALWRFWEIRGQFTTGRNWLEEALSRSSEASLMLRAAAHVNVGSLACRQGDPVSARTQYETALALYTQDDNPRGMADVLNNLGVVCFEQADYASAETYLAQAQTRWESLGEHDKVSKALNNRGILAWSRNDLEAARSLYEAGLDLARTLERPKAVADILNNLGTVAKAQGDLGGASAYLEEGLALLRELGSGWSAAYVLCNLADIAREQGTYAESRSLFLESLSGLMEAGDLRAVPACLEGLAEVATAQKDYTRAARLFGAAERLREDTGAKLTPTELAGYEHSFLPTLAVLGDAAYQREWAGGRSLSLEQAVVVAKEGTSTAADMKIGADTSRSVAFNI